MYFKIILFIIIICSAVACEILVPQPGIEPAVEARNHNHWTTREVPRFPFLGLPFTSMLNFSFLGSLCPFHLKSVYSS